MASALAGARQEHGIAAAAVIGLQSAIVDAERREAEDNRVIQEAQQRAEARRVADDAAEGVRRALEAMEAAREDVLAELEELKRKVALAESWQQKVYFERQREYRAQVTLGERPDGMSVTVPNAITVLRDQNPVVRALMAWSR